jgi:hypothetical protein
MTASTHLEKLVEFLKAFPMKLGWAAYPVAVVSEQALGISHKYYVLALLIWCAHRERMQDKRHEFLRETIDELLAHQKETNQPIEWDTTTGRERLRIGDTDGGDSVRAKPPAGKRVVRAARKVRQTPHGTKTIGAGTAAVARG